MGTVVLSDMISRLSLEVVGSYNKKTVELRNSNFNRPGLQLVGYFDAFPYGRVQIIGKVEMSYLNSLDKDTRKLRVVQYMDTDMPFIIFSRGYEVPEIFISSAKKHDIPLFRAYFTIVYFTLILYHNYKMNFSSQTLYNLVIAELHQRKE